MAQSVAENIKKIREMYELGRGLPLKSAYGKAQAATLATEKNVGHGTVYRAKQFARMFSKKDVDRLCKLCRDGNSLSWCHLPMIFKVKPEQERWNLLNLAVEHGWSARELAREVDKRYPNKRKYGGGKPKMAADAAGLVKQISRTSESWLRFDDQLRLEDDEGAYRGELPIALRDALRAAYTAMQDLNEAAESVQLQPTRAKRKKK
ncbi:MAG: hypothetical protein CMJ64_26845 [Planctomycetaceae bacterium]|jgi:hypothetical protein|nr:hypothetical protein [Planctomycetaceae bacterium]